MALQTLRFAVAGDVQYSRAFEAAAEEARDLSEPLEAIGDDLIDDIHEQFRTEGAHGHGSKWQSLNPDYAEWKRQQVGEEPILVFTGKGRAAMIAHSAVRVSPRRLVYDPDAPDYMDRHQTGDGVPQRKMIELPETSRRRWDRHFATWLNSIRRERLAGLPI
jgi:hypothetical protein